MLQCALNIEKGANNTRYLILSCRKSNKAVVFGVNPNPRISTPIGRGGGGKAQLPLIQVTYLDLKAPVISIDVTTVLGVLGVCIYMRWYLV